MLLLVYFDSFGDLLLSAVTRRTEERSGVEMRGCGWVFFFAIQTSTKDASWAWLTTLVSHLFSLFNSRIYWRAGTDKSTPSYNSLVVWILHSHLTTENFHETSVHHINWTGSINGFPWMRSYFCGWFGLRGRRERDMNWWLCSRICVNFTHKSINERASVSFLQPLLVIES